MLVVPVVLVVIVLDVLDVLDVVELVEVDRVDVDEVVDEVLVEETFEEDEVEETLEVDELLVVVVERVDVVIVELDDEVVVFVLDVVGLVVPPVVVAGFVPMAKIFALAIAYTLPLPNTGRWFFMSLPVLTGRVICCSTPFTGTALYATKPLLTSVIQTIPVPGWPFKLVTTGTPLAANVRDDWPAKVKNGFPSGPRPKLYAYKELVVGAR